MEEFKGTPALDAGLVSAAQAVEHYEITRYGTLRRWAQMLGMNEAEIGYMLSMPAWMSAFWALGVWGSVLGSVLLLVRSRHAVTAFLLSLVGLAISCIYQFGMHYGDLMRMFGAFPMIFTAV